MIQPNELKAMRPMHLHDGAVATTTDVWNMLTASRDGDLSRVRALAAQCPAPLAWATRRGHPEIAQLLAEYAP